MPVPYTFGTATASIPLSQLDSNFATAITIGNTAVQLGNTVTTLNNMTLANVTISSGNVTITNVTVTTANATTANVGTLVVTSNATVGGNISVTGNVSMNVATITTSNVTTENVSSLIVTGNQTFVGTGNRITGDFSNATVANRVMFQTSTTNGNTVLNLIPNGTGTTCAFGMDSDPALTNSSTGSLNLVASTDVRLSSGIRGTGTYLPMTFYTGGSERMRVDTSGNVGIGTSSPSTIGVSGYTRLVLGAGGSATEGLTIVPSGTGGVQFTDAAATEKGYIKWVSSTGALNFGTAGTTRLTIDSSGNVGIGNTTVRNKLDVVGNTGIYSTGATSVGSPLGAQVYIGDSNYNTASYYNAAPGFGAVYDATYASAAALAFYTYAGTTNARSERMRIDSSGNLLVGDTTYRLSGIAAAGQAIQLGSRTFIGSNSTGDTSLGGLAGTTFTALYVNGGEKMRIDSSGNLLVGTTTATSVFTVASSGANIGYFNSTATNGSYSLWANSSTQNGGVGSAKGLFAGTLTDFGVRAENNLILGVSSNERVRIDTVGNVQVQAGAVMPYAPAPASISTTATLTNANIQAQIINTTGTTYTVTMPLGTTLETLATWATTNVAYDFFVINTATGIITMAVNTGVTSLGLLTIAAATSAHFRIRRTAANTFVLYRLV